MKIEINTKLNVGDEIWYMKENKPVCYTVNSIKIEFMDFDRDHLTPRLNVKYKTHPCLHEVPEYFAFKTKGDLMNSVFQLNNERHESLSFSASDDAPCKS